jgi:hypothetical protein
MTDIARAPHALGGPGTSLAAQRRLAGKGQDGSRVETSTAMRQLPSGNQSCSWSCFLLGRRHFARGRSGNSSQAADPATRCARWCADASGRATERGREPDSG